MGIENSREQSMSMESDEYMISSWKNIANCFYQRDVSLREATMNLVYTVGIYNDNLVDQHLSNEMFRIQTVQDYIIQKVIQILSLDCKCKNGYENMISMKPWSYYKLRDMMKEKPFVLEKWNELEEIANDRDHTFWSLIYVSNCIPYEEMNTFRSRSEFWIKLSLLFGNITIAKNICYHNKINIELFNDFVFKYCPQELYTE